jgi:DnaJ-class molecular chaperone
MNYYIILGIEPGATDDEIREAYRRQAQKYHPDHYGRDASQFLRIQEAYRILSDPQQRKKYDRKIIKKGDRINSGATAPEPIIPGKKISRTDSIPLFNSFDTNSPSVEEVANRFQGNFHKTNRSKADRLRNLKVEIELTSIQAQNGGRTELLLPVEIRCPLCHGSGGIEFWQCLRCNGFGIVAENVPLLVTYPGGIQNHFTKSIPLRQFGITNLYLTVSFIVSKKHEGTI